MTEEEKQMLSFLVAMIKKQELRIPLTYDEINTLDDIEIELGGYDDSKPRPFRGL